MKVHTAWQQLFGARELPATRGAALEALGRSESPGVEYLRGTLQTLDDDSYARARSPPDARPLPTSRTMVPATLVSMQTSQRVFLDIATRLLPLIPELSRAGSGFMLHTASGDFAVAFVQGGQARVCNGVVEMPMDPGLTSTELETQFVVGIATVLGRSAPAAELLVLLDQFFGASCTAPRSPWLEARAKLATRIQELAPVVHGMDGPLSRRLVKFRYLYSDRPGYSPNDPGVTTGVAVHGYDTQVDTHGTPVRHPGHVMATHMSHDTAVGEHLSYSGTLAEATPAGNETRRARLRREGVDTRPVELGQTPLVGPFRGSAPFATSAQVGMLQAFDTDRYRQIPKTFCYRFDTRLIDPRHFDRAVRRARAVEEAAPHLSNYVMATAPVAALPADKDALGRAWHIVPGTFAGAPERLIPITSIPGAAGALHTTQATNCVTALLQLLMTIKTARGDFVIDGDDLSILGLQPDGSAFPGRDLLPQQLYEHLRFKEHELSR